MLFRKTGVTCRKCRLFVPDKDNPNKGRCHTIEIEDADEKKDGRWYGEKEEPAETPGGSGTKKE